MIDRPFLILPLLTLVWSLELGAAPDRSITNVTTKADEEAESQEAEKVQMDSLSLPELVEQDNNPNKFLNDSHSAVSPRPQRGILLSPHLDLFSGPTAAKDRTTGLLFGVYFNKPVELFPALRFGIALSNESDLFLHASYLSPLSLKTWGNPYWLCFMNSSTIPSDFLSTLINMHHFTMGFGYGIRWLDGWRFEAAASLLGLKGSLFLISGIYDFRF